MNRNVIDRTVTRCFTRLCWRAATPFAMKMLRHLQKGEWIQLVSSAPDPSSYTDAHTYQSDAMVGCFFKKYADLDLGFDLKAKAVKSFYDNEASCYRSNERLGPFVARAVISTNDMRVLNFIDSVRKVIKSILGPIPNSLRGRFGPGSTFGDIGNHATLPDKMSSHPSTTREAYETVSSFWEETAWARYGCNNLNRFSSPRFAPETVRGNRFTAVPKDALKHRGICIEPSINLYYQLGVGEKIRSALQRVGLDIRELQPVHRELARKGSIDGRIATIDLSNASDTICKALVKLLLPSEWHELLSSLRSGFTLIDGRWIKLEKFSSMGNGYTFELETLLFYAIAKAVQLEHLSKGPLNHDQTISVYGDDIIVPTEQASDVISALSFFGLTTNKDKTFISGPFRESCGGDYFMGLDVRPHFLKESPNEPQQLIVLANGIFRCGKNAARLGDTSNYYHSAWLSCIDALPTAIRACKGPSELGDIVIHQDAARWIDTRRERNGTYYLRCYRPLRPARISWDHWRPGVVLATAVYGSSDGTSKVIGRQSNKWVDGGGVFPRQSDALSYKTGWVAWS